MKKFPIYLKCLTHFSEDVATSTAAPAATREPRRQVNGSPRPTANQLNHLLTDGHKKKPDTGGVPEQDGQAPVGLPALREAAFGQAAVRGAAVGQTAAREAAVGQAAVRVSSLPVAKVSGTPAALGIA